MTWISNKVSPTVVCRPALPMDTFDALELTRHIWEGDDYVPQVWAEWLRDPEGLLAVAEYAGVVVGFGKLTKLSAAEWWLEGLRVHPEHEGRGIASRLNNLQYEFWLRKGSGIIRMATSSNREAVKHIAQKRGFLSIGEYSTFEATVINEGDKSDENQNFTTLNFEDIDQAIELLRDPDLGWSPYDLLDIGWQWVTPQRQFFKDYVSDQQAWWWRDKQGILIQVEKKEDTELWARIRMLACSKRDLNDCLTDTRKFAGQCGYDRITWLAPLTPDCEEVLKRSGFQRSWDGSLLIFEKEHPQKDVQN
jgi:GNAT superfamily N-acetyltransferase